MLTFKVLYEDSWILIVDKPAGFYSHSPEKNSEIRRISPRWNGLSIMKKSTGLKNLSPVHRLDQKTSGLWMLSKTVQERSSFQQLFSQGKIQKDYVCATKGRLPRESFSFFTMRGLSSQGSIQARTTVSPLFLTKIETNPTDLIPISLVKARLITGKTHQIRKHFSCVGHPILNDKKYGDKKLNRVLKSSGLPDSLYLRSQFMHFIHPISQQEVSVNAPWNRQWHQLFDKLGYCPI